MRRNERKNALIIVLVFITRRYKELTFLVDKLPDERRGSKNTEKLSKGILPNIATEYTAE